MLPFRCVLCYSYQTFGGVCAPCLADIESLRLVTACRWCAAPGATPVCGQCLKRPPAFDGVVAAFIYQQPLVRLIHLFKYGGAWQLAKTIAKQLPLAPSVDLVVPTPLHVNRERKRGFNQARELAKGSALSVANNIVQRIIDTLPQVEFSDVQKRRQNIRGAFSVVGNVMGKSILMVDDVMTSGATLNELAESLKCAGATRVYALVAARAAGRF